MAWARFLARFDFSPTAMRGRVTISYKAGTVANVTRECRAAAVAKGAAVPMVKRNRFAEPEEVSDGEANRRR